MAGTFLCIGLSFVVVAVIILSTIGYHKIYVETGWATEIEEDLPEKLQQETGEKGYLQVLPTMAQTDGFFVSCFEKTI